MNLHVTLFGAKGAEAWVRHAHNIPPHVGLGWTPYRALVQSNGGTLAHSAFTTPAEFKQWLKANGYRLTLQPHHRSGYKPAWVARFGTIAA